MSVGVCGEGVGCECVRRGSGCECGCVSAGQVCECGEEQNMDVGVERRGGGCGAGVVWVWIWVCGRCRAERSL